VQVRWLEEESVLTNINSRLDLEDSKATHVDQPLEIVLSLNHCIGLTATSAP